LLRECPYCRHCGDRCGREGTLSVDDTSRAAEVYAAAADLYSRDPSIIRTDCLYVAQQLVGKDTSPKTHA
jgi:hypothetical protein